MNSRSNPALGFVDFLFRGQSAKIRRHDGRFPSTEQYRREKDRLIVPAAPDALPPVPQAVVRPLTRAAIRSSAPISSAMRARRGRSHGSTLPTGGRQGAETVPHARRRQGFGRAGGQTKRQVQARALDRGEHTPPKRDPRKGPRSSALFEAVWCSLGMEITSMSEHKPTRQPLSSLSKKERYKAIDEALQRLARSGLIVDTGRRRWSKRTRSYQVVWGEGSGHRVVTIPSENRVTAGERLGSSMRLLAIPGAVGIVTG